MANGYLYRGGPWEYDTPLTTASTGIAVLDALKATTGKVLPLTAGVKAVGVALQSKAAGDSATTAIQILRAYSGRTKWFAEDKVGAFAATDKDALVDLSGTTGAMGFDSDTSTNDDFYVFKVLVTGSAGNGVLIFADPSYHHATN